MSNTKRNRKSSPVASPAEITEVEAGLEFSGSQLRGLWLISAQRPSEPSAPSLSAQGQGDGSKHFQTHREVPTGCLSGMCEGSLFVLFGILS